MNRCTELVAHLRPGMDASALDPIERETGGFISEAILREATYDLPCSIGFDQNTICQVTFGARWSDPEAAFAFESADALMAELRGRPLPLT